MVETNSSILKQRKRLFTISVMSAIHLLLVLNQCFGAIISDRVTGIESTGNDSLVISEMLINARAYINTNPDSARTIATEAANKAQKSGLFTLYASALNTIGVTYYSQGNLNEAITFYRRAIKVLENNNASEKEKFKALQNMGRALIDQGKYLEGVDLLNESYAISRRSGNRENISLSLFSLGQVYYDLAKYEAAMAFYIKANYYARLTNDKLRISQVLHEIGNVNFMRQQYSQAFDYYNQSLKIKEAIHDEAGMAVTIQNIGSVYEVLGDNPKVDSEPLKGPSTYYEALNYYNRALEISQRLKLKRTESLILSNIGAVQIKTNQLSDGIANCKRALLLAEESGTLVRIQESSDNLSKAYQKLNEPAQELFYFKKYTAAKDSIYNEGNQKKLNQVLFDQELEVRMVKQKAEAERQRELSRNQEFKILVLLGLLVVALLVIGLIIWQRKKITSNYSELVKKNLELMKSEEELIIFKEKIQEEDENHSAKEHSEKEKRISKSILSEEQAEFLFNDINRLLFHEKLYLDADLTLQNLVEKVNSNTSYVSRVINDKYGKNLSTLINEFRIKEARRILADPANNQLTIEGIAWQVGFKSVTSFNLAFKKYTGISPSFFKAASQNPSENKIS